MPDICDDAEDLFPVLNENWQTVELFVRFQTQWRVGIGGIVGLDYASILAACRICRLKMNKELFEKLQIMERAAIEAFSEKRS